LIGLRSVRRIGVLDDVEQFLVVRRVVGGEVFGERASILIWIGCHYQHL